jgi:hypothetical protein
MHGSQTPGLASFPSTDNFFAQKACSLVEQKAHLSVVGLKHLAQVVVTGAGVVVEVDAEDEAEEAAGGYKVEVTRADEVDAEGEVEGTRADEVVAEAAGDNEVDGAVDGVGVDVGNCFLSSCSLTYSGLKA